MSDSEDLGRLANSYGKVTYIIKNGPSSNSNLDSAGAAEEIALAFRKWSAVSNFDFVQVAAGGAFDISLEFDALPEGSDPDALAVARRYTSMETGKPLPNRQIIFSKDRAWDRLWPAATWDNPMVHLARLFNKLFHFDLMTAALHEIGHALGLPHSTATGSIMQSKIGVGAETWVADGKRALVDADAEALAALYAGPAAKPLPADATGYAIVGSTFRMKSLDSDAVRDFGQLCWGARVGSPAGVAAAGYGWNPMLYPAAKGYGFLFLHLMRAQDVGDRPYVIGGGTIIPGSPLDHWSSIPDSDDYTRNGLPESQRIDTWGRQDGDIQICARFTRWVDAMARDTDSLVYFVCSSNARQVAPAHLVGYQTEIGTSGFTELYEPQGRQWLPTPHDPKALTTSPLAWCRTWRDERTDAKYDWANSRASLLWY